jgi:hypothetical protein
MGSARADQRDPLQQLKWMQPKAMPGQFFEVPLMDSIGSLAIPGCPTNICHVNDYSSDRTAPK